MDEEEFRNYCIKEKIAKETIEASIGVIKEFDEFLKKENKNKNVDTATPQELHNFVSYLIQTEKNIFGNFVALIRYSHYSKNDEVKIALYELLDGSAVIENLSNKLKEIVGQEKRNEIFKGIDLPPLGTRSEEKPKITKIVMERLDAKVDEKTCKEVISSGLHEQPKEGLLREREKYQNSKNIDDFLEKQHKDFVAELEQHRKEGTLFFTQEVDEQVIEYVRNNPMCEYGVREGDIVYVTKIPYMAKQYLNETDEQMKRYYYCHCSWVREALKSANEKISPTFCYCSAGFYKQFWDVVLDQSMKVDVVESILKGDPICKFAVHLPNGIVEAAEKAKLLNTRTR